MIGQLPNYNGCLEQEGEGRGKKGQAKRRKQEEGDQTGEEGERGN